MSMYEPLRQGFSELNKMMIDGKVFDAQQKASESESIRQDKVLASNLDQRAFDNAMGQAQIDLSRGRLDHAKEQANATNKRADKEFQYTKAQNEIENAHNEKVFALNQKTSNTMDEVRQKNLDILNEGDTLRQAERNVQLQQLKEKQDRWTAKPWAEVMTGLGPVDDEEWMSDPLNRQKLVELVPGGSRWGVDKETGKEGILNIHGELLEGTPDQVYNMREVISDMHNAGKLTMKSLTESLHEKTTEFDAMKARKRRWSNPRTNHPVSKLRSAEDKAAMNKLSGEIKSILEDMNPEAQLERFDEEIRTAEKAASWYAENDLTTDANLQMKRIEELRKDRSTLYSQTNAGEKYRGQKMAVEHDPKTGTVIRSGYFAIPINAKGVTPSSLDPENWSGENVMWKEAHALKYGDSFTKPKGMKTADYNFIKDTIAEKYAETTYEKGGYAMNRDLGMLRDMTWNIADQMVKAGSTDPLTVGSKAALVFGQKMEEYFALRAEVDATANRMTPEQYEKEIAELEKDAETMFGRVPQDYHLTTYTAWKQGDEYLERERDNK